MDAKRAQQDARIRKLIPILFNFTCEFRSYELDTHLHSGKLPVYV